MFPSHDRRANQLEHFTSWLWGALDSYWISYYLYPHLELRKMYSKDDYKLLCDWADLSKSCFWWYPFKNICFVCDRPTEIHKDEEGRLHCDAGPAVSFLDKWSTYVWHGTNIPANWIEDKSSLTAEKAITWENIEQRRCACEIIGWHNILDQLDAKEIDRNPDDQIGTLVEVNLPDSGRERFLRVKCGTGRDFALPVPPDIPTAAQANAWTYGLDVINPEVRT